MKIEPDFQREFDRINFDRQVKLEFIDDSYYTKVENLSLSGMFIKGAFEEKEGNHCLINLYQSDASADLSLQAAAEVVRKNEQGMAVRFISMGGDSFAFLQSTVPQSRSKNFPFKITDASPIFFGPESQLEH